MRVIYVTGGAILLIAATLLLSQLQNENQSDEPVKAETETAPPPTFSFKLIDESLNDTPIKAQVEQHVVVSGDPSADDIMAELRRRHQSARNRRGWQYHDRTTNVYIYIYGSEEQARAGQGLWLGMVSWSSGLRRPPDFQVNEDRLASLGQEPENRFGLTEPQRKQFMAEYANAQQRAMDEAMRRVPDSRINEQIDLERELAARYEAEVLERWGLTKDQAGDITEEAITNGWAF